MRECPKASTRPPLAMCTGGPLEGIGILIRAWAACAVGFTCHFCITVWVGGCVLGSIGILASVT